MGAHSRCSASSATPTILRDRGRTAAVRRATSSSRRRASSLDDFDWRLSLAQVDRDGPFSRFDNVDRTLVLLSGAMTLHEQVAHRSRTRRAGRRSKASVRCTLQLAGGSSSRFQRHDPPRPRCATQCGTGFRPRTNIASTSGSTIILFALESGLTVDSELLDIHDTAVMTEPSIVVSASAGNGGCALVRIVEIRPNVL